jgi:hypothetical protein
MLGFNFYYEVADASSRFSNSFISSHSTYLFGFFWLGFVGLLVFSHLAVVGADTYETASSSSMLSLPFRLLRLRLVVVVLVNERSRLIYLMSVVKRALIWIKSGFYDCTSLCIVLESN